jgi:hypothetical protein
VGNEVPEHLWRESDLDTLPDEPWACETVSGSFLREPRPMPRRARIAALVDVRARWERTAVVHAGGPGSLLAREPDTVRGSEVALMSRDRRDASNETGRCSGAPDPPVEALSRGNSRKAMRRKVADSPSTGARAAWVVDPRSSAVAVPLPGSAPRHLERGDVRTGDGSSGGFRISVDDPFDRY